MTLVNIDLRNQGYETGPDDRVIFYSLLVREGDFGTISTAPVEVPLVDGKATVDLAPGPVGVQIIAGQVADTRVKEGRVPMGGPTTLSVVLTLFPEYSDAIRAQFLAAIRGAQDEALTRIDAEVAVAVDAEMSGVTAQSEEALSRAKAAEGVAATANVKSTSATSTASTAVNTASNAVARVTALEAMAGMSPESPVDGQQANLISQAGTLTRQALNDGFARKTVIDANLHGVVADGVTDDQPAWQAIVNAAQPGDVITWTGRSAVYKGIVWKSGISLIGQGWGKSVLVTKNIPGVMSRHAAIRFTEGDGASKTNTLADCVWADFEVDGGELEEDGTYWISAKGLFTLYHERCQWRNLYIHDTQATGLGCDFMRDCTITGVVAERCGYMNPGNVGGGAGIGIGTGAWEYEPLTISDCHTRDCGNWGIFVEVQEYHHPKPYGTGSRIIGCTSEGDRVGFGDRGTIGTTIANCVAISPKVVGISVSFDAREGIVEGNHIYKSGGIGIDVQRGVSNYMVRGNHVLDANTQGVAIEAGNGTIRDITVESNHVTRCGNAGIFVSSISSGAVNTTHIIGNRTWNNGQKKLNPRDGIHIEANMADAMIVGNRAFDDQAEPTQTVGIRVGFASSLLTVKNPVVTGNNLTGSVSGISFGSSTFEGRTVADNVGWPTSAVGTASFADGATTVTVPHGIKGVPTQVQVTPQGAGTVWVKTRGVSNLIFERAATTGVLTFDWQASVKM